MIRKTSSNTPTLRFVAWDSNNTERVGSPIFFNTFKELYHSFPAGRDWPLDKESPGYWGSPRSTSVFSVTFSSFYVQHSTVYFLLLFRCFNYIIIISLFVFRNHWSFTAGALFTIHYRGTGQLGEDGWYVFDLWSEEGGGGGGGPTLRCGCSKKSCTIKPSNPDIFPLIFPQLFFLHPSIKISFVSLVAVSV